MKICREVSCSVASHPPFGNSKPTSRAGNLRCTSVNCSTPMSGSGCGAVEDEEAGGKIGSKNEQLVSLDQIEVPLGSIRISAKT